MDGSITGNKMVLAFLMALGILLLLYSVSKNKYLRYIKCISKKDYPLRDMLPIGLFVTDILGIKFTSQYSRRIFRKISMVYGTRYAQFYNKVFWGNKITTLLVVYILVTFYGAVSEVSWEFLVAYPISTLSIFYMTDRELTEKNNKRLNALSCEFPEFVTKVTLLINAGMTVQQAIFKAYPEIDTIAGVELDTPLKKEIRIMLSDLKVGTSEMTAYKDFAERCGISQVKKFMGIINQNIKIGSSNFVYELKSQGTECWENRKNVARKYGEEASTKLLLPMMIMFAAVLLVVMTPALLAFNFL